MPTVGDSVYIDAFCPSCEAAYYRSVRPLIVGRDKLTPDLFAPIKAGTPPPDPSQPKCPTCSSPLRFLASTPSSAPRIADEPETPPVPSRAGREAVPARPASASSPRVDVLFAVEGDEQVVDMKDAGGSYIVVTNKRIVKVSYE